MSERVEKLVEKWVYEYYMQPGCVDDAIRGAIAEARREALKECAAIVADFQVDPLPTESGAEVRRYHNRALGMALTKIEERLAGEEGTK